MPRRRYEDDDDDRPRSRRPHDNDDRNRRPPRGPTPWQERRRRNKKGLKLPLILGGSFALLAVVLMIIIFSTSGNNSSTSGVGNVQKGKSDRKLEVVESIFGGGTSSSATPTNGMTAPFENLEKGKSGQKFDVVESILGKGTSSPDGNNAARNSIENFDKINAGLSFAEVEKILGPGTTCTINEIVSTFARAFDERRAQLEYDLIQRVAADRFYAWRGNDMTIFVGFGRSQSGVERAAFSTYLRKNGGRFEVKDGLRLMSGADDVDQIARQHQAESTQASDPKWQKGEQLLARQVVGEWRSPELRTWRFRADGTYEAITALTVETLGTGGRGKYRIAGPQKVDLIFADFPDWTNSGPVPHRYSLLVNDDELMLFYDHGAPKWVVSGPYYRMRPEGGGLAQKLVLDPFLRRIKSKNGDERRTAVRSAHLLGPTAGPLAPDLIDMLKAGDHDDQNTALEVIKVLGPECKRVVPTLIALLRNAKYVELHREICVVFRSLGPDAREALPALRDIHKKVLIRRSELELLAEAIGKIEGR